MTVAYLPQEPEPLPHNLEAEQALLGAILMQPRDALPVARSIVAPKDFHEGIHATVFEAMLALDRQGRVPALPLLAAALRDEPDIAEGVTVVGYLARLAAGATSILNVPDYARTVRDFAVTRRALDVADGLKAALAGHGALRPFEAVREAVGACDDLLSVRDKARGVQTTLAGAIRDAHAAASARRDRGVPEIATGLSDLDRKIGGFDRGQLIVIGGRPAMGKSAFLEYLQITTARAGQGSATFSYEMNASEFGVRAAAYMASERYSADRLEYSEFRQGIFTERQGQRVAEAAEAAEKLPAAIISASGMSVHDVASRARRIRMDFERRGADLAILFVDYLQLVTPSQRYSGQRVQEVGEISTALKAIAQQMNVCVVLLSQLSRQVEQRDNKRPRLSDLRESGNIEQDADLVLFLYREAYYLKQLPDPSIADLEKLDAVQNVVEIIVDKQRHGDTGIVRVFGDMATGIFRDLEARR